MNVKLLLVFLFVFHFGFSQTEKLLKGVVSSENFLLENVDVINKNSQKSTTTNDKGEFIIAVKANDSLLVYAKDYHLKRLKISTKQIELNNLQIIMLKKPEELEEVVIEKTQNAKFTVDKKYEKDKRDDLAVLKSVEYIKKRTVYEGTIDNGMNLIGVAKKLVGLFVKEKEPAKEPLPEIEFATLAINTCGDKYLTDNLKLKPDEILLFLQFCDVDPKSKKIKDHTNILSMMDFLMVKNNEFQKLKL